MNIVRNLLPLSATRLSENLHDDNPLYFSFMRPLFTTATNLFASKRQRTGESHPVASSAPPSTSNTHTGRIYVADEVLNGGNVVIEADTSSNSSACHHTHAEQRPLIDSIGTKSGTIARQSAKADPSSSSNRSSPLDGPISDMSPSQARTLIADFLRMKEAEETPLNSMEVEGLIVMLQRASKDGDSFHIPTVSLSSPANLFQTLSQPTRKALSTGSSHTPRPAPSNIPTVSLPTLRNNVRQPPNAPRKFLIRNPNGEYRWIGAGSAKVKTGASARPVRHMSDPNLCNGLSPQPGSKRKRAGDDCAHSVSDKEVTSIGAKNDRNVPSSVPSLSRLITEPRGGVFQNANDVHKDDQTAEPAAKRRKHRVTIEDASDDDDDIGTTSAAKSVKPAAHGHAVASAVQPIPAKKRPVTMENPSRRDVKAASASSVSARFNTAKRPRMSTYKKSFAPKEPSKLRQMFVAVSDDEDCSSSPATTPAITISTTSTLKTNGTLTPSPTPSPSVHTPSPTDPRQAALAIPEAQLPKYGFFTVPRPTWDTSSAHVEARREVMAMDVDELPVFDLTHPVN